MSITLAVLVLFILAMAGLALVGPSNPGIMKEDRSIWSKIFRVPSVSSGPITAMAVFCGSSFMMIAYDNRQSEHPEW